MDQLELLDWRRRVADLYAEVRASPGRPETWASWRAGRDALLGDHPQTPLAESDRETFVAAEFFDYDPSMRFEVEMTPAERMHLGGEVPMTAVGRLDVLGASLTAFWLDGYAGGLFVPFRDATNGSSTYGGGHYLLDTAKGADLGSSGPRLVLDFNYAYHPSCAFDDRWVCPLAGRENVIPTPVHAGELLPRRGSPPAA